MINTDAVRYNEFCKREMNAIEYPAIRDYATNEFFNNAPLAERKDVFNAYQRIENQEANTHDVMLVMCYYCAAKLAWRYREGAEKHD